MYLPVVAMGPRSEAACLRDLRDMLQSFGRKWRSARGVRAGNFVHGHAAGNGSPTHRSWTAMRERCRFHVRYIQLGITVDPRWDSFANFLADMGERPEGTTLDRIDGSKGYGPGNCRWATPKEQAANRRPRAAGMPARVSGGLHH